MTDPFALLGRLFAGDDAASWSLCMAQSACARLLRATHNNR